MMDKSYQIVNEYLTKDDIHNKYGDVSFAYTQKQGEKYKVIAISALEQQYLKSSIFALYRDTPALVPAHTIPLLSV